MTNASPVYDFFSQMAAFRKSFEGLEPKVFDLSCLSYQEAGGQIKGSGFHGTLISVHGVRLVAVCPGWWLSVCLTGFTITGAAGGGVTSGTSAPLKAAAAARS